MKDYKKIFKVASNGKLKPVMGKLYVENGFVYATDAFKAIKLNTNYDEDKKGFITKIDAMVASEKSKDYRVEILPELSEDSETHPGASIDRIIPTEFAGELTVNRKYLIDLLEALQKGSKFDQITIKFPATPRKPLLVENDNGIGLLMPIGE